MKLTFLWLALSVATPLLTTSCVDTMYSGGDGPSSYRRGFNTYSTLPSGYAGDAYFYNGRYYSGGRYQTGSYAYQGRNYSNRYYHGGQYLYGGTHQHHQGPSHSQSSHSTYRNSNTRSPFRSSSYQRSTRDPSQLRHPSFGHRL